MPEMVHVTYQGIPIYIQHVNESNETARIYPLHDPRKEQTVPVSALKENFDEPDMSFV